MPTVTVGVPRNPKDYDKFEDNGITVYLQAGVECPKDVTITVEQFLWMERLAVEGMI